MNKNEKILLSHGGGGTLMHKLIQEHFIKKFDNEILNKTTDSASIKDLDLFFTTDSYVVNPLLFPGGDIGKLAVCGTANDIAVMGAVPLYISAGFIIEEGLDFVLLDKIIESMAKTANSENIKIVTGDLKVVEKGNADKLYINTSGIGKGTFRNKDISPGDKIIINGTIGDHGIAVLTARGEFKLQNKIKSDCAPLTNLIQTILKEKVNIKFMRDPTRGGLASTLNEIVNTTNLSAIIDQEEIPVRQDVLAACELLGFDPLYLANEGKVILIVSSDDADITLKIMQKHILGKQSKIIGEIAKQPKNKVLMKTKIGGTRIVDMLVGDQLPRIC